MKLLKVLAEEFSLFGTQQGNAPTETGVEDPTGMSMDGSEDPMAAEDDCQCQCTCPCCQKNKGGDMDDQKLDFSAQQTGANMEDDADNEFSFKV